MRNCARMERELRGFVERSDGRSQSPRIGETNGPTVCVFSSALVKCGTSFGGAAADNGWSCFKTDYHWSILRLQELTASNGVVTETAEGHQVFATPPCNGQLRLAIVVATETLPFVIGGSFSVKGKNCALDVC